MGRVVIVGGGIIGLYTAFCLSEAGLGRDIVVVANKLPGDQSIEYTSPVAGAHFSCAVAGNGESALRWCKTSYPLLKKLFKKFEGQWEEAGLGQYPQIELFDQPIEPKLLSSYKAAVPSIEEIKDKNWLRERGATYGIKYPTFNFYPPKFLKFLKSYLEKQGVKFVRANLKHISEAPKAASIAIPAVVFNCTGVLATKLGGITDPAATYPVRGQVISVRAPWIKENISLSRAGFPPTYIIPRVHSGGRVILGGYYDQGDWTEGTLAEQTESILARTTQLWPELLKEGPLEVVEERAGLRPGRDGGARVEPEIIDGQLIIHNYGAAGIGFQCGLGMADDAVKLYLGSSPKL